MNCLANPATFETQWLQELNTFAKDKESTGCSTETYTCSKDNLTTKEGMNLEAMMNRYSNLNKEPNLKKNVPQVYIFVSMSMPEQSLKLWSEQARRLGATLLLRGFIDNSIQKTTQKIATLFKENEQSHVVIDPERFQRYQIRIVPAVVLLPFGEKECVGEPCPQTYDVTFGDTSLTASLECMVNIGSNEAKKAAAVLLKQIKNHHD